MLQQGYFRPGANKRELLLMHGIAPRWSYTTHGGQRHTTGGMQLIAAFTQLCHHACIGISQAPPHLAPALCLIRAGIARQPTSAPLGLGGPGVDSRPATTSQLVSL